MTDQSELIFIRSIGPDRLLIIDAITDAMAKELSVPSWGYHLFDVDEEHGSRQHIAHLGNLEAALHFQSIVELIEERAA